MYNEKKDSKRKPIYYIGNVWNYYPILCDNKKKHERCLTFDMTGRWGTCVICEALCSVCSERIRAEWLGLLIIIILVCQS